MTEQITISSEEFTHLEREAKLKNRSTSEQAEHWLRLGRYVETLEGFDYNKVRLAVNGKLNPDELSRAEGEFFEEGFFSMFVIDDEE